RGICQLVVAVLDRLIDEFERYERNLANEADGKFTRKLRHALADLGLHIERIRAGRLEHCDARRRPVVDLEDLPIALRAQLGATDVAHARDLAGIAGLDDDILELFGIGEAALHDHGVLERLALLRGRPADLAGGDLLAL